MTKSRLFSLIQTLILAVWILPVQSQTPLVWGEGTFITEEENGFRNESGDPGWHSSIMSGGYNLADAPCFIMDITNYQAQEGVRFAIALGAESGLTDNDHILEFRNGNSVDIEDGLSTSSVTIPDPKLEIHVSTTGIVTVYSGGILIYTFTTVLSADPAHMILSIYTPEVLVELVPTDCGSGPTPPTSVLPCSAISSEKYTESKAFAPDGTLLGHSLEVHNNWQQPLQHQHVNLQENKVLAKAFVYDRYGRPAIETFEAPLDLTNFCYDQNFITATPTQGGNDVAYDYTKFDQVISTQNNPGEEKHPFLVSPFSTLGKYYSNTTNPNVSDTRLPYGRKHYSNDLFEETVQHSGYNETFRAGGEHENYFTTTVAGTELAYVYGFEGSYMTDDNGNAVDNGNLQVFKRVTMNENGETSVVYSTADGLTLASCLSGGASSHCVAQKSTITMHNGVENIIHVPATKTQSIQIRYPDPGGVYVNATPGVQSYAIASFDLEVYDKINRRYLVEGTDYTHSPNSTDVRTYDIALLGAYASAESILSIACTLTDSGKSFFEQFLWFKGKISLAPYLHQELDYDHWKINYYDTRDNPTRTVHPEAINCNYNASLASSHTERHRVNVQKALQNSVIYSVAIEAPSNNDNKLRFGFWPAVMVPWVSLGRPSMDPTAPNDYNTFNDYPAFYQDIQNIAQTDPGGQAEGEGEGGESEPVEPYVPAIPSVHYATNQMDAGPSTMDPASPTARFNEDGGTILVGAPAPDYDPALATLKLTYKMEYRGDLIVQGVNSSGITTELDRLPVRLEYYTYQYVFENTSTGTFEVYYDDELKRFLDNQELDWKEAFMFNKISLSSNLDQYVAIELVMDDVEEYDDVYYESCSGCALHAPNWDVPSPNPEPPFVTASRFNFQGEIRHRFVSKPDPIAHGNLVENYRYDARGRMISEDLPDQGRTEFVYADDGRLRFTQDAEQRTNDQFSYVNYDRAHRPVETGVYSNPSSPSDPEYIAFTMNAPDPIPAANVHAIKNAEDGIPDGNTSERNFYFYDLPASDVPSAYIANFQQTYVRGRLSRSKNDYNTTWYSYDFRGNVNWTIVSINGLGTKTTRYHYDQVGRLTGIDYNEQEDNDDLYIRYTYNANGALTDVRASNHPQYGFRRMAHYDYDVLGNLVRKELGNELQGIDYFYTAKGQIKSINNAHKPELDFGQDGLAGSRFFDDLFAETLTYYYGDFQGNGTNIQSIQTNTQYDQYTGRIKTATWYAHPDISLGQDFATRPTFRYSYDGQGRLTLSVFGESGLGGLNSPAVHQTAPNFTADGTFRYRSNYTYDRSGNLTALQRYSHVNNTLMDNLTLNYNRDGNNQLTSNEVTHVGDAVANVIYSDEISNQGSGNYLYDALGRMTRNVQQSIDVEYYSNDLVKKVKEQGGSNALEHNYYDENGRLVRKVIKDLGGFPIRTEYRVYDLQGRVLAEYTRNDVNSTWLDENTKYVYGIERIAQLKCSNTGSASTETLEELYQFKDHIGNVRAEFTENELSSTIYTFPNSLENWNLRATTQHSYIANGLKMVSGGAAGIAKMKTVTPGQRFSIQVEVTERDAPNVWIRVLDATNGNAIMGTVEAQVGLNTLNLHSQNTTSIAVHIYIPGSVASAGDYFTVKEVRFVQSELKTISYKDYYPFGFPMPGRQYTQSMSSGELTYQGDYARFNDRQNWHEFDLRHFDSRLGRWLSPDPARQYYSPYLAMGNNPVSLVDPTGAWAVEPMFDEADKWSNPLFIASDQNATMGGSFAYSDDGLIWGIVAMKLAGDGDPPKGKGGVNPPGTEAVSDGTNIDPFGGLDQFLLDNDGDLGSIPVPPPPALFSYTLGDDSHFTSGLTLSIPIVKGVGISIPHDGSVGVEVGPLTISRIAEDNVNVSTNIDLGMFLGRIEMSREYTVSHSADMDGDGRMESEHKITYKETYSKAVYIAGTVETRTFINANTTQNVLPPQYRQGLTFSIPMYPTPFSFGFSVHRSWKDF